MEKTIEIISEKVNSLEKSLDGLSMCHNASVKNYDSNFAVIGNWHRSDRKFHKFVVVAGVIGAYRLYKQNKELKALKAKIEEQGKEEK